jgi:hypothetical protein
MYGLGVSSGCWWFYYLPTCPPAHLPTCPPEPPQPTHQYINTSSRTHKVHQGEYIKNKNYKPLAEPESSFETTVTNEPHQHTNTSTHQHINYVKHINTSTVNSAHTHTHTQTVTLLGGLALAAAPRTSNLEPQED